MEVCRVAHEEGLLAFATARAVPNPAAFETGLQSIVVFGRTTTLQLSSLIAIRQVMNAALEQLKADARHHGDSAPMSHGNHIHCRGSLSSEPRLKEGTPAVAYACNH